MGALLFLATLALTVEDTTPLVLNTTNVHLIESLEHPMLIAKLHILLQQVPPIIPIVLWNFAYSSHALDVTVAAD